MIYQIAPENLHWQDGQDNIMNIATDRLIRISYVYLHGTLEDRAVRHGGYDIFSFIDEAPQEEGIFDAITTFPDGEEKCKVFLWHDKIRGPEKFHGLVVSVKDTEGLKYAQEQYETKSMVL